MNKKIEELNKELEELRAKIEEVQKKIEEAKQTEWPSHGDHYWAITSRGGIIRHAWFNDSLDHDHTVISNVFKTEDEVKFEVKRLRVIAELKKFAMNKLDWRTNRYDGERYYMYLSGKDEIKVKRAIGFVHSTLYFESPEKAKAAIAAVGESRVKKYYFEVDEE